MSDLENMLPDIAEVIDTDTGMDATLVIFGSKQYVPETREVFKVAETRHAVKVTPPTEDNTLQGDTRNTRITCMIGPDVEPKIGDNLILGSLTYKIVEAPAVRVPGGDIGAYQLVSEL